MAKIVFVQDIAYEYFGVMYLSAYLKAHGHECDVIIEGIDSNWLEKLEQENPDLIGFSTLTGSFKWALGIAEQTKAKLDKPVIFGGVHVFTNPEETLKYDVVDIVCTGEGEEPLKQLCDSIDAGAMDRTIPGMWFKTENGIIKNTAAKLIDDLDTIPFADRTIYWKYPLIRKRNTFPLLGSRGCPYSCAYCFIPTARKIFEGQGKFVRQRSAENIIAEIENCLNISSSKKMVHFVEDHFGNNRDRTLKILQDVSKLKNGTMKWAGAIRVERFNKDEYVEALSKTNHEGIGIAVECGNEKYRNTVLKRETTNEEIITAADLANKHGIKFTTLNMMGLPGETYEMALETLDLNIRIKPVYAQCFIYQPYPNTELQQYSVEHNYYESNVADKLGFSFYDRYNEDDKNLQKLINLQRVFALTVKLPWLKPVTLKLVEWNAKYLLDLMFGVYYMWYLYRYYKLTLDLIYQSAVTWLKNRFSWVKGPASISVKAGTAQLYSERFKG